MPSCFAPAKLNLFLAVTGRRADGFHDLVSVVATTEFGDVLEAEPADAFSLICDQADVPTDETNLVLKAATAFSQKTGWRGGARFKLEKRIPMGAGLGGGSSDAVAALRALDEISAGRHREELPSIAATIGSDCPLFLYDGPVVMRGRGERVAPLPDAAAKRLRGRRVLIFKPSFAIATPWSYAQLAAAAPGSYLPLEEAENRLQAWIADEHAPIDELLFNNMEFPAFRKFVALPTLLDQLERAHGLRPRMSGSGSACFAFLGERADVAAITESIRSAWGPHAFVAETRLT